MFEGHAGLSLQADDTGEGAVRRALAPAISHQVSHRPASEVFNLNHYVSWGKRYFGGAPHVADSNDVWLGRLQQSKI